MQERRLGTFTVHPLTPARWADLERLFGPRGACGGCWCMWWRAARTQFVKRKGEGNRRALKRIVSAGGVPGLLAYAHGQPVGWCAVGPRGNYPVLEPSRVLKRVDKAPVWSLVCFFVAKPHRRQGLTTKLLRAAVKYARRTVRGSSKGTRGSPHRSISGRIRLYWSGRRISVGRVCRNSPEIEGTADHAPREGQRHDRASNGGFVSRCRVGLVL